MCGIQFRGPGNYTRDVAVNFKADASEMANYCLLLFLLPLQLFCGLIEKSKTLKIPHYFMQYAFVIERFTTYQNKE